MSQQENEYKKIKVIRKRAKVFETHIHKHYSLGVPFSDTNTFLSLLWCWDNCLLLFLRLCVCYKSVLFWNGLYSAVCWTLGVRKRTCFCTASAIECMESWRWIVMAAKLALLLTSLTIISQTIPGPKNTNFVVSQHSFGTQTLK